MNRNKRYLIIAAIALPAVICGGWFWLNRDKAHAHKAEKLSGETSFDVYAQGGRIHMLVLREHGAHQSVIYRQFAAGDIVREVALPTNPQDRIISRRSNDVQTAAAGDHLLAAWQVAGTGYANRGPIRTAESFDAGQSWRQSVAPTAAKRTDDQGFFDIEADNHGNFHLVWLDSQAKIKVLRYASLADGKWSAPQTIDAETCQCCWNSLRKNPQGELAVLYRNARPRDMALAKFDGKAWLKAGIVDGFGWKVEMCPHAGGGIAFDRDHTYAVTWTGLEASVGCHLTGKKNSETAWQKPQKFGNTSARNPDIAVNGTGIAIVWDEFEGENRRAKFMRLANSDTTAFPAAQTISSGAAASYPRVVTNEASFHAFWTEIKNGEAVIRGRKL
jgi:hypothetical protein